MSIILLHPLPPFQKLYFHLVQGSGVMGMGSRKLTKLCGGRRDSGVSWLLQSPGRMCFLDFPRDSWGLGSTVFLISFMSSSGSGACGNLKDERSLGQNPGQEDPESSGSYYFPGLLPWAQFYPIQSRGCFCISSTAQLWSWFCILYRQSWAIFSSQEFRRKGPLHLELHCLKEIVAQREAAVGFLKVQNNQAVSCSLHLWSWVVSSMGGNHE